MDQDILPRDYIILPSDYWFPGYNSTEGVKALEFVRDQIDAGIKPQKEHFWGKEFLAAG
jgi:hypothetical protein